MKKIPGYRLHAGSGQAVVVLRGQSHYLGVYGTPESRERYGRLIAEYLSSRASPGLAARPTVSQVLDAYVQHVAGRHGRAQHDRIVRSLGAVRNLYGSLPAAEFRGRALKAVRHGMVSEDLGRRHINHRVDCIKRCWRWALSEELVPADAAASVFAVAGLRAGEVPGLREPRKVGPAKAESVEATLPFLPRALADCAQVQLYSGCRPGEALRLRLEEIDRSQDVWSWSPLKHKTASRGHRRVVHFGPRAVAVLGALGSEGWAFPAPSGRPYSGTSYANAVRRACARAGVEPWHPNMLRHAAATLLASACSLDVAQAALGHRSVTVTQIYAEADLGKVREAIRKLG